MRYCALWDHSWNLA